MLKKFNCSPKLDQAVKLPTRPEVSVICSLFKNSVVNSVLPTDDLIDTIGYNISKKFSVDVLHAKALEVESTQIDVNAFYDQDLDETEKTSIELVLVTNPNDDYIILNDETWELLINRIADSLAHELIHMRQSRSRNFLILSQSLFYTDDVDKELHYLSLPDEIDAYAYNIATELEMHPNPREKLANPSAITVKDSVNLWAYVNTFSKDLNNPILKKLFKKIYKHLSHRDRNNTL